MAQGTLPQSTNKIAMTFNDEIGEKINKLLSNFSLTIPEERRQWTTDQKEAITNFIYNYLIKETKLTKKEIENNVVIEFEDEIDIEKQPVLCFSAIVGENEMEGQCRIEIQKDTFKGFIDTLKEMWYSCDEKTAKEIQEQGGKNKIDWQKRTDKLKQIKNLSEQDKRKRIKKTEKINHNVDYSYIIFISKTESIHINSNNEVMRIQLDYIKNRKR